MNDYKLREDHEIIYCLHAKRQGYQSLLSATRKLIARWIKTQSFPAVSWSAGKDSTACLFLALEVMPDIAVYCQYDDLDCPEKLPYIESIREKYNVNLTIVEPNFSLKERVFGESDAIDEDIHSQNASFSIDSFYLLLKDHERKTGYTGRIMGLRAEESWGRKMNALIRGAEYRLKSGMSILNPIVKWKGRHVFAYLVSEGYPINPIYRKVELIDKQNPEKIRSNWLIPGAHARKGAAAWIRYHYPRWWEELLRHRPEVSRYA